MGIQVSYNLKDLEEKAGPLEYEELYPDQPKTGEWVYYSVITKDGNYLGKTTSKYGEEEVDLEGTGFFSNRNINNDLREYLEDLGVPYSRG